MILIRLHVLHANRLYQDCLRAFLSTLDGIELVGHSDCSSSEPGNDFAGADVVLVDVRLPGGGAARVTQNLRAQGASTKVIVLVPAGEEEQAIACVAAGVQGCVVDDSSLDELQDAITTVVDGESFCSPRILQLMFDHVGRVAQEISWREASNETGQLTHREQEILDLVSQHLSNKQIARRLNVSLYTVKNHIHNILDKLQVRSRFEAVEYARQRGLIESAR